MKSLPDNKIKRGNVVSNNGYTYLCLGFVGNRIKLVRIVFVSKNGGPKKWQLWHPFNFAREFEETKFFKKHESFKDFIGSKILNEVNP